MATRIIATICLFLLALTSTQASSLNLRAADKKKDGVCGAECVTELVYPFVLQSATDGFRHALWAYNTTYQCLTHQDCRNNVENLIDNIAIVTTEAGNQDAEYWIKKNKKKTCEKECLHDVLEVTTRHAAGMGMAIGQKNFRGVDAIRDRWIPNPMVELYQMMSNLSVKDTLFNLTEFAFSLPTTDLLNGGGKKLPDIGTYAPDTKFKGDKKHHVLAHRRQSSHHKARAAHELAPPGDLVPRDKQATLPYDGYREPGQNKAIFWDRAQVPLKFLKEIIKHKGKRGGPGQHPNQGEYIGPSKAQHAANAKKYRQLYEDTLHVLDQKNIVGREDSWLNFQQMTRFDNTRDDTPWDRWMAEKIDHAPAPVNPVAKGGRMYEYSWINDLEMPEEKFAKSDRWWKQDGKVRFNDIWQWVQPAGKHDTTEMQPGSSATFYEYPEKGAPKEIRGYQMEFKSGKFRDFSTPVVDADGDRRIWPKELFNFENGTPVHPRNKEKVPTVEPPNDYDDQPVQRMVARVIGITGETEVRYLSQVGKPHKGQTEWEIKDDSARSILDAEGKKMIIKLDHDTVLPTVPYISTDDGRGEMRDPGENPDPIEHTPPEHPDFTPTEVPPGWTAHETSTSTSSQEPETGTTERHADPTDAPAPLGTGPGALPPGSLFPVPIPIPITTDDHDDDKKGKKKGQHSKTSIGGVVAPVTTSSSSTTSHSTASVSTFRSWGPMPTVSPSTATSTGSSSSSQTPSTLLTSTKKGKKGRKSSSSSQTTSTLSTSTKKGKKGKKTTSSSFATFVVTANSTMTRAGR